MKRGALTLLVWLVCSAALGEEVRIKVATLDGEPVYRWRAFKSAVADDVDRALILREFQRKQFKVPAKLVDDAVSGATEKDAGGDAKKFAEQLRRKGASMNDFRLFTSEEIIMSAMRYQSGGTPAELKKKQEVWLAGLRKGVVVKRLSVGRESSR